MFEVGVDEFLFTDVSIMLEDVKRLKELEVIEVFSDVKLNIFSENEDRLDFFLPGTQI